MSGVTGFTPISSVPSIYKTAANQPHTDMHDAVDAALTLIAGAVPTALADLPDDVDLGTVPTGLQIVLARDPNDGKWKPAINSFTGDLLAAVNANTAAISALASNYILD